MVAVDKDIAVKAQSHMADVVASVKGILTKITDRVDSSKGSFQGEAAAAFLQAAQAWDDEAQQLNKALDEFQDKVGQGTNVFEHTDIGSKDLFTKALTNLG
ncbi:WXG100 family type VII secretion target [Nocardia sp. NPDC088792]|uniref:WXG100 family type VII secretion target n=1 Tax=Nocardia sp. NPDC088792 TaxID=3364332 RepID=UPI0037FBE9CB